MVGNKIARRTAFIHRAAYAGGVRVMRIGEESRLVSLCRAPHEDEEEIADSAEPAEAEAETPAE